MLAEFWLTVSPRLWDDLLGSGVLPPADADERTRQRHEWECVALHACVRGLVAAGGFDDGTAASIDALHERVLSEWMRDSGAPSPAGAANGRDPGRAETFEARRARLAERYGEYGELEGGGDAHAAATRLGEAAARHIAGAVAAPALAELVGTLHEALTVAAAEAVRAGVATA
jgi:hypothetical protein